VPDNSQAVSRRQFTKILTFASLAVAAGAVWALVRSRFLKPHASLERVIAHANEIPVGSSKIFQYPTESDPCILVRAVADSYVAYSRLCTHATCPIYYRAAQNTFECPCHQGFFSVADGSVLSGPPPRPLPRVTIERRGQDIVATGVVKG
jgi:nitrite reductase/ring-hydroxylating ferredoxin subunit